jgi:hypothetical protein
MERNIVGFCRSFMTDNEFNVYSSRNEISSQFRKWAKVNHPDKGGDPELFISVSDCKNILLQHFDTLTFYNYFPFLSNVFLQQIVYFCISMILFIIRSKIDAFVYSLVFRMIFGILDGISNATLPIWIQKVIYRQKNIKLVSRIVKTRMTKKKSKKKSTKKRSRKKRSTKKRSSKKTN